MKRYRFSLLVSLLILGGLLSGCMGPTSVPAFEQPVANVPGDYSLVGTANYIPVASEEDPYPLFVGARWLYRNAAKYWSPTISASGLLESEVVAIVQGDGVECYVLRTHYSNGPDQLLYLHRTKKAVGLRVSREISASGSQINFSLNPGLAFLELPLEEDATWLLKTGEGVGEARVYHREVAAIESGTVSTMLGSYSPIFLGTWRIHYSMPEISPRLYGGPVQFLWFADGVGVVKHVLNSVDYELAEFRLPNEIVVLEENNEGQLVKAPNGGLVVVQLREGEGWEWEFAGIEGLALDFIGGEFYADTPRAGTVAGTRAFQLRAMEEGEAIIWFELIDRETGMVGDVLQYTIRVN
jgi:hypothetical protein